MVLKQIESFLAKPPDSSVATIAVTPKKSSGRWVQRKLGSTKKKVDLKPKRLGRTGTWVNSPEGKEEDQTQTLVELDSTVVELQRQDTLTDP